MKKWIAIGIIVIVIIIVGIRVIIAFKDMLAEPAEQEIKPIPVEVYEVGMGEIEKNLLISGIAESTNQVEVVSKISGKIISIPISLGSYVYAGSTIAVVDRDEPSLGFKNYTVVSPISGYVAMIMHDVGDYVSPGIPIALLVKKGSIRIKCNVTEKDLPFITKGIEVRILINGEPIPGTVKKVSGVIDTMTYSSEVEIRPMADVEKNRIVPGTFVDIEIPLQIRRDVIIIPKEALVKKNGEMNVFVVKNDITKLIKVEVGISEKDIVEIKGGLTEGDRVVVVGVGDVEDGSKVKVVGE